jgi:hypothetical protein
MAQRRPKRRGPQPKDGAIRREAKVTFIPGPTHERMLEDLANARTKGNKTLLIRLLLEEASSKPGKNDLRLVLGSRGRRVNGRASAAQGTRGFRLAA